MVCETSSRRVSCVLGSDFNISKKLNLLWNKGFSNT
jgi:hypothetical protein